MLIQIPPQQRAPLPQAALAEAAAEAGQGGRVLGAGAELQQPAAGLPHLPGPVPRQLGPGWYTWSLDLRAVNDLSRKFSQYSAPT